MLKVLKSLIMRCYKFIVIIESKNLTITNVNTKKKGKQNN